MDGFRTHKDTTLSALLAAASAFRLLFCGGFTAEFLKADEKENIVGAFQTS